MKKRDMIGKNAKFIPVKDKHEQRWGNQLLIWIRSSEHKMFFKMFILFSILQSIYCLTTASVQETTTYANTTTLFKPNLNSTERVDVLGYQNRFNVNDIRYGAESENSLQPLLSENLSSDLLSRNGFSKDISTFYPAEAYLRYNETMKSSQNANIKKSPPSDNEASSGLKALLSGDGTDLDFCLVEYLRYLFDKRRNDIYPNRFLKRNLITDEKIRRISRNSEKSRNGIGKQIQSTRSTGRLLISAGLKKVMWPIYMGFQILKSLMFAMLLPTLIGSVGQLLGKGILTGSAPLFIRPMDTPQDLDFKDNQFNFENERNKFTENAVSNNDLSDVNMGNYVYQQQEASQLNNQYAPLNPNRLNQITNSRYGMTDQQTKMSSYLSALQTISSASFKNSNSISGASLGNIQSLASRNRPISPPNANTFQTFQKVPASSLLLSNYDPFYSPLLSRLDSVFAQLKLKSENEVCREKAICLMYANPAKYAPYSNLVSAQLSRELNELRKPTSDNSEILRFFKYMRAAKDGQDGVDCEKSFNSCKEFKDFENPAMVSTFHDINKLVQARKLI